MRRKLFSAVGIKVAAAFIVLGIVALGVALLKALLMAARLITPRSLAAHVERFDVRSPLHRLAAGRPCSKRPSTIYCLGERR
jgi:hypothetical protein